MREARQEAKPCWKLPDVLRDLRKQRLKVEAQNAALIDWLDATEPYSDLEPDADLEGEHDLEQADWRAA